MKRFCRQFSIAGVLLLFLTEATVSFTSTPGQSVSREATGASPRILRLCADDAPAAPNIASPDFPTHILPILTKAGCNAGACHGAATGQAGFKLSLLGYDPEVDYATITRELSGRRIDVSTPGQSLILLKATRNIRHKGGLRIEEDSKDFRTVLKWIGDGAAYGPAALRVAGIEVRPGDALLNKPGESVRLKISATLSDGTVEDVTAHALYSSNDDGVARVDEDGTITMIRRGLTAIMVRYGGRVAAVRIAAPFRDAKVPASSLAIVNFIDEKVFAELQRLRVPPSARSTDAEFLRRVFIDMIGRLPTADEARSFLKDTAADKRARVIGELLGRDEFVDLWTLRLGDWLLIDSKRLGLGPAKAYQAWVREQVARNTPLDKMVSSLITSVGDFSTNGPANFNRLTADPRDMSEYVSSAFLGIQIACARCHTHPFAAWTQDDYYRFAAYFARTRQEGGRVVLSDRGEVQHPKTHKDAQPKPLGEATPRGPATDRLAELAAWTTSSRNPYFAKAIANRIWRHLMGRGIVEPVDDLRVTNPPSNPALLDNLTADFVAGGYDLRRLIATIVKSNTYQLSSAASDDNRADDRLFSHAYAKPLGAQVLADSIAQASGVPDTYADYPAGTRAVQLIDARPPSEALDVLGRCTRDINCETQSRGGGVSQALHLINGSTINAKLRNGIIDQLLRDARSDNQIIEELYLRTLTRLPSEAEKTFCTQALANTDPKREAIEDLLWALLNSREFVNNH